MDDNQIETRAQAQQRNWIETISLHQFRNYKSLKLIVDAKPVVLVGNNGAGKTNLLEAVSLLSPGQGLRRAAIAELGSFQDDGDWAVSALVHGAMGKCALAPGSPNLPRVRFYGVKSALTARRLVLQPRWGGVCKSCG